MIEITDKKLLMTYDKETEKAFKILNSLKSKNKGIFNKIAFQKNEKGEPAFYASDKTMLAEYTPICDVCLGEANKSFLDFQLDYKNIHIDKEKGLISCDVQYDYFPTCSKLFIDFKKLYGVHIPDRKDFIKYLENNIACNDASSIFIEFCYDKKSKTFLVDTYIYAFEVDTYRRVNKIFTYSNIYSIGNTGYFEEGNTIKVNPKKLLKLLKPIKSNLVDFYFEKQNGQLYFEEDRMRYLLMHFLG